MSWNKEETFDSMVNVVLQNRLFNNNGKLRDNTLTRRLQEGYRLLVLSYSDHDMYTGVGTEYINNPIGGEVNGLQASMSAVDYVTNNYPTTYVYAHGTSAGATGSYSLGLSYYMEGIKLTGVISDSLLPTLDLFYIMDEFNAHPDFNQKEGFDPQEAAKKLGPYGVEDNELLAAEMIDKGYDVPMLGIGGTIDPFYGDHLYTLPVAEEAGYESNVEWLHRNIDEAINNQENSPHRIVLLETGHVPSIKVSKTSDYVDTFIEDTKAYNGNYPFE